MTNTIEEQQRQRAEGKAAAIDGLLRLVAALQTDQTSYCTMTCHGTTTDEYGIERDQWALEIAWRGAAALYMAPEREETVAAPQEIRP